MKNLLINLILFGGILFLFGYFSFHAIISVPFEFDSIVYHIPLAKSILNGQIFHSDKLNFPNSTFPASSELILAFMLVLHIPLNLFNVIAWVFFGYLLFLLGKRFNLKNNSLLFSFSIMTLPTVMRLLLCQTADIWLAVFFVWTLYLLQKPEKKLFYFFQLGLSSGFLIGSKFSGPLFLAALFLVYGKKLWSLISIKRTIFFLIPFIFFGLSWYIRNILVFSNPFYPAFFLWMKGVPTFFSVMFPSHFKMITSVHNGFLFTINAIISEYLFWPLLIVLGIVMKLVKKKKVSTESINLFVLGCIGIVIYLAIPGYAYNYNNYVSEIRYSIPIAISFILAFFIYMQKIKLSDYLYFFVFLNFAAILTLFFYGVYHPKIIVMIGVVMFFIMLISYLGIREKKQYTPK